MDLPRKGSNVRPSLGSHLDESENEVERFSTAPNTPTPPDQDAKAAAVIQRNYRGYRTRRQLAGYSLDPSNRWTEAVKEAQFRNLIRIRPRAEQKEVESHLPNGNSSTDGLRSSAGSSSAFAHQEWRRIAQIARRAGNDDTSDSEGSSLHTDAQRQQYRREKLEAKRKRENNAKMMGLEYFLEMVDEKHRYGSHLRAYHVKWKEADTHENFFYWLDYGDGKSVEVPSCSREKLEIDQVRYLSREERYKYLVKINKQGRLYWAKNGEPVNTSIDFRDSLEGIVKHESSIPAFREEVLGKAHAQQDPKNTNWSSESGGESSEAEGQHYVNHELDHAHGVHKVQYVSAAALLNHLLQSTTKKNTWIFVADTSFRLYIGIKQSGAFQHSSFLHGGRISAAGLIKVKQGQLRSLSPLSGHYRPPTKNFRAFVHSLRDAGVDMSRVSISKSYAVLLGLEGYMKTKKKMEAGIKEVEREVEWMVHPEDARERERKQMDMSKSAQKERKHLEKERLEREQDKASWMDFGKANRKTDDPGKDGEGLVRKMERKLRLGTKRDKRKSHLEDGDHE